jgi:hypothetical protein
VPHYLFRHYRKRPRPRRGQGRRKGGDHFIWDGSFVDRFLPEKAGFDSTMKIVPDFSGSVFNHDRDRENDLKIAHRFFTANYCLLKKKYQTASSAPAQIPPA